MLITLLHQFTRHCEEMSSREKDKFIDKLIANYLLNLPSNRKLELRFRENEKINLREAREDQEKFKETEAILRNRENMEAEVLNLLLNKGFIDREFSQMVLKKLVDLLLFKPINHSELNPLPENEMEEYKQKLAKHKKFAKEKNAKIEKLLEKIALVQVPPEEYQSKEDRFCALFKIDVYNENERKYKEELQVIEENEEVAKEPELSDSFFDYTEEDNKFKALKEEQERRIQEALEAEERRIQLEEEKAKRKQDIADGIVEEEVEKEEVVPINVLEGESDKLKTEDNNELNSSAKNEESKENENLPEEVVKEEPKEEKVVRESEIISYINSVEVLNNQALEKEIFVIHENVLDDFKLKILNNFLLLLPAEIYERVRLSEELTLHNTTERQINEYVIRHILNYRTFSKFKRELLFYNVQPPKKEVLLEEEEVQENKENSKNMSRISNKSNN